MKKLITLFVVGILFFNIACSGGVEDTSTSTPTSATSPVVRTTTAVAPTESIPSSSSFKSTYDNFGPHFSSWLSSNGYSFSDGGFGGFRSNVAPVTSKKVVVFIHGNGSRAHGSSGDPKGWYNTYKYLREQGYNNSELYAVNYGYEGALYAAYNDHRSSFVNVVKNFINAVYAYTGKKVTVVAHSLGCTVTRKAMKDGNLYSKIDTYISIAGAHHGLPTCGYQYGWYYFQSAYTPTCSSSTGFLYPPNYMTWLVPSTSYFIGKLNDSSQGDDEMQGKTTRTYVIMSTVDELAGVRSTYTSKLAGAYKTKVYSSVPYGHFNIKDLTASVQKQMIERTY